MFFHNKHGRCFVFLTVFVIPPIEARLSFLVLFVYIFVFFFPYHFSIPRGKVGISGGIMLLALGIVRGGNDQKSLFFLSARVGLKNATCPVFSVCVCGLNYLAVDGFPFCGFWKLY